MVKKIHPKNTVVPSAAAQFLHRALVHTTGALGVLISISFFTATYDTAQVKLTLLHMGGLLLAALWASLQLVHRESFLSKANWRFWGPVLLYLGWNIVCYACAPFHADGAEEFIRFVLYGLITLLAAGEFDLADIKTLTKWFLAAVWISFSYAAVQIADGFSPGLDPMPWRGWFTKRIFSTHANPNFFADFVIFSSCILGTAYMATRRKKYLFLGALGAVALFFTESKGAWLAYALTAALGTWLYANFCAPSLKQQRKKINGLALAAVLAVMVLVGAYTARRFQSVSFRMYTWQGVVNMIKDYPLMGVGTGNFKTVYAAYRLPQIFYIESSHNTETQHAENELLEQWAVSGTVGLVVFLWLVCSLFVRAGRKLRDEHAPRELKIYLLGYTAALAGMLLHSIVDVSLRFASSGFFLALFMGFLLALCRPELAPQKPRPEKISPAVLVGFLRLGLCGAVIVLAGRLVFLFHQMTAVIGVQTVGEGLLFLLAWAVFLVCLCGGSFVVLRSAWKIRTASALVPLLLLLPLEAVAYAPFQANHLYSLAIAINNRGNAEGAVGFFTQAIRFNPLQTEYYQFRGNVLATLFNLTKQYAPARGDKDGKPSDDYSRALADYRLVLRRSPNHPLLHHNIGQLYYRMALTRSDDAARAHSPAEYELFRQEALDNMALAQAAFERSLQADPVNPETYMYLVQIGLLENNPDKAQTWLDKFYRGPQGVTETEFLQRAQKYLPAQQLQRQVEARRAQLASRRGK